MSSLWILSRTNACWSAEKASHPMVNSGMAMATQVWQGSALVMLRTILLIASTEVVIAGAFEGVW